MQVHSIDEIPTIQDASGWKYVTNLGFTSIKSFKTSKEAATCALNVGLYELVGDETAGLSAVTKTQYFDGFQIDT